MTPVPAHHLNACVSPRNVRKTGFQLTTPRTSQAITPSRRESLRFRTSGISAVAVLVLLAITPSTARADCRQAEAPDEVTCAKADVRLWVSKRTEAEADLALEQALTDRLTRELAACRETQGACEPRPTPAAPYPWNTVVTVGVVGVAVGVVLGVVLAL